MLAIDDFLSYLRYERGRSALTVKSYGKDLVAFEEFFKSLDNGLTWETVDEDVIRDWMASMMDKGNKATSVDRRLSSVRTFFRYALSRKLIDKDPSRSVVGPKKDKPLPQFLKEAEMNRLLDDESGEPAEGDGEPAYKEVLAHAVLMTFYETGMRLSELTGLTDTDVDFDTRELKVTGKGNKQRVIPFGEELAATLAGYKRQRDHDVARRSERFFLSKKGLRLSSMQVYYMVRTHLSTVSTLKKRSPHVLRHTFATAMLNHRADLESVKNLLGHESLSTTEIYTHTTFEQLKRVYTNAHPRA